MSEARHTPPPWELVREFNYQGQSHLVGALIVSPGEGYAVAEIRGAIEIDGLPHEIHLANAHLVRTAPELLEALQEVLPHLDRLHAMTPPGASREQLTARISAARAAVARARNLTGGN